MVSTSEANLALLGWLCAAKAPSKPGKVSIQERLASRPSRAAKAAKAAKAKAEAKQEVRGPDGGGVVEGGGGSSGQGVKGTCESEDKRDFGEENKGKGREGKTGGEIGGGGSEEEEEEIVGQDEEETEVEQEEDEKYEVVPRVVSQDEFSLWLLFLLGRVSAADIKVGFTPSFYGFYSADANKSARAAVVAVSERETRKFLPPKRRFDSPHIMSLTPPL